jgi:hypothetical protein
MESLRTHLPSLFLSLHGFECTVAGTLVTIGYGYTTVKGILFRNIIGQWGASKFETGKKMVMGRVCDVCV